MKFFYMAQHQLLYFTDKLDREGGCESDLDCPLVLACENGICRNPCPAGCGTGAFCSAQNHRPVCHCQPGYAGDPQLGCTKSKLIFYLSSSLSILD